MVSSSQVRGHVFRFEARDSSRSAMVTVVVAAAAVVLPAAAGAGEGDHVSDAVC